MTYNMFGGSLNLSQQHLSVLYSGKWMKHIKSVCCM